MDLGRQPPVRQEIETALVAWEKGEATPEAKAMFRDWSVMVMATLAQAIRFEQMHEARPEDDRTVVDTFFKVLRVRAQQNSVAAKLAKQQARLAAILPQAVVAPAEVSEINDAVVMPREVFEAVRSIVGSAAYEEKRNWEEHGKPDDHVWHLYQRVSSFLDEQSGEPSPSEEQALDAAGVIPTAS